jgi:hypothetical protein
MIATSRVTIAYGSKTGFDEIESRILGNKLMLKITNLTINTAYTITIRPTENNFTTQLHNKDDYNPLTETFLDVDIDLPQVDFIVGNYYYLAVGETGGQERLQVKFKITQNLIGGAGSLIVNFLSADFTLSGTALEGGNKVVDLNSKASQVEAETGTNNNKWMSPLRTDQAFTYFASNKTFASLTDFTVKTIIGGLNELKATGGGDAVPYTGATGNVDLGAYNLKANKVELNISPTLGTLATGDIFWDTTNHTASLNLNSQVNLQLGQEVQIYVRNNTASVIPNGSIVYQTGVVGGHPTIALALANVEATTYPLAVATQNIQPNDWGYCTTFGKVRDLNTNTFNENDEIFLSSVNAGQFTATPPASPNYVVKIGSVVVKNSTNGEILVNIQDPLSNNNSLGTSQKIGITQNAVKSYIDTNITEVIDSNTQNYSEIYNYYNNRELIKDTIIQENLTLYSRQFPDSSVFENITTTNAAVRLVADTLSVPYNLFTSNVTFPIISDVGIPLASQTLYLQIGFYSFGFQDGAGSITSSSGTATVTAHQTATQGWSNFKTIQVTTAGTVIFTFNTRSAVVNYAVLNQGITLLPYEQRNSTNQSIINLGTGKRNIGIVGTQANISAYTTIDEFAGRVFTNQSAIQSRLQTPFVLHINNLGYQSWIKPTNFTGNKFLISDPSFANRFMLGIEETNGKIKIGKQNVAWSEVAITTAGLLLNEWNYVGMSLAPNGLDFILFIGNRTTTETKTGVLTGLAKDFFIGTLNLFGQGGSAWADCLWNNLRFGAYEPAGTFTTNFNNEKANYGL